MRMATAGVAGVGMMQTDGAPEHLKCSRCKLAMDDRCWMAYQCSHRAGDTLPPGYTAEGRRESDSWDYTICCVCLNDQLLGGCYTTDSCPCGCNARDDGGLVQGLVLIAGSTSGSRPIPTPDVVDTGRCGYEGCPKPVQPRMRFTADGTDFCGTACMWKHLLRRFMDILQQEGDQAWDQRVSPFDTRNDGCASDLTAAYRTWLTSTTRSNSRSSVVDFLTYVLLFAPVRDVCDAQGRVRWPGLSSLKWGENAAGGGRSTQAPPAHAPACLSGRRHALGTDRAHNPLPFRRSRPRAQRALLL